MKILQMPESQRPVPRSSTHALGSRLMAVTLAVVGAAGTAAELAAQSVDYPSSTLASPPQLAFPFYTPGGGSSGQTVRMQMLCTDAFLATQGLTAGLVTKIGLSVAGQAVYDVFELRAGASSVAALGSDWTVNLPDQRLQRNLSNTLLVGGGTVAAPANQWVEYALDYPFYWQPGQSLVIDITSHMAVPGVYVNTTLGSPAVPRAYNANYSTGGMATSFGGSGVAFRMVFASTDLVTFGSGCSSPGSGAPVLGSVGAASLGGSLLIVASGTLDNTVGGFLFGFSRRTFAGGALPLGLGGGCELLVSPDVFASTPITPVGGGLGAAGFALSIPVDPLLVGAVVYAQFAQFDANSPASLPLTFSDGGIVVVF